MTPTRSRDNHTPVQLVGNVCLQVDSSQFLFENNPQKRILPEKKSLTPVVTPSEKIRVEFHSEAIPSELPNFFFRSPIGNKFVKKADRFAALVAILGLLVLGITFSLILKSEKSSVDKVVPDSFVNPELSADQKSRVNLHENLDEGISIEDQVSSMEKKIEVLRAKKMVEGATKTVLQVAPNF